MNTLIIYFFILSILSVAFAIFLIHWNIEMAEENRLLKKDVDRLVSENTKLCYKLDSKKH
jgi:hypothetical protein